MKKLIRNILLFTLLNAPYFEICSQEYTYTNFQTKDGLPSVEVYHAIQDSKGYIWFATDNGVSRFDGYKFVNFDKNNGLVNNTVFDLYEDQKGRIWFIALSGRLCYYKNGEIKQFKYNQLIDENTKGRAIPLKRSFHIDTLQNIYLGIANQGILRITENGKISNLIDTTKGNTLLINEIAEGEYLTGYSNKSEEIPGLFINGKNIDFNFKFRNSSSFFSSQGQLKSETYFIVDNKIFKQSNSTVKVIESFSSDIIWFSKDENNNYWVSVRNNGIKCYNSLEPDKNSLFWFLKDKDVSSVLIDSENGYWFTTLNNGVFYLPTKEIKTIDTPTKKSNNVLSIEVGPNSIYLGMEQQILCYNKDLTKINQKFSFTKKGTPLQLAYHNELASLISTTYDMCYLINGGLKNGSASITKQIEPKGGAIKSLATGKGKYFWVGTYSGLYKITGDKVVYNSESDDNWQQSVYSIIENNDNSLWLGTLNGLWEYKNGEYINHGKKNELFSHRINALYKNNNNLFIGTKGKGLIILDLNDYSTQIIDTDDGLSSNSVTSIAEYKNEIWIGTNKGVNMLAFLNNKLESISRIDYGQGLKSDEINQILINENKLYIASREGFNYIDLDKLQWTQSKPLLHIQNLKINYLDTVLEAHYQLSSHQNNIEISYVGISYKSTQNMLYKYQLLPYDEKWKITHSTSINYSSLLPGNYEFRVMAMNESGTWSDVNNSIKFTIDYPFYKKWWFYVLSVILITLILFLSLQYMLQKIRKENKLRTELKRHTQKSIAAQLNPHFIFNSLNSLNYLILKNDKLESSKYLSKLSTYLRATFDALQKEKLTLNDEIKIVSQYLKLEKLRLKDKLDYEISVDEFFDSEEYKVPGLFILPLLENAIWKRIQAKNDNGFIKITIEKDENYIIVLIEDNGIVPNLEGDDSEGINIDQRRQLLNEFYKGQIIFDFIPNTQVSFNETGNIVKLKLHNKFR